ESLALDNGCTLAAYPCRPAAVRGIRARIVSFNNIHQSDNAFVVAATYSASVGIGGLVGSRPIWSYKLRQRAPESIAFLDDRNQCTLASVDDRPQLDKVQIEANRAGIR